MKILICTMAFLLAFTLSAPADNDNAVRNGDFEKGKMGWKTKPGVHVIDITDAGKPTKVLEAELDKNNKKTDRIRFLPQQSSHRRGVQRAVAVLRSPGLSRRCR